jgi:hypothetical protein
MSNKSNEKPDSTLSTPQRAREKRVRADIWRPLFLNALRNSGNVRASCQAAGINRTTAYKARDASEEFSRQWDEALEEAVDSLEAAAWRRARDGVTRHEPIMFQGDKVAEKVITEYSDSLMTLLLKAHRPEKYRERVEHSNPDGTPLMQPVADAIEKIYGAASETD